MLTKTHTLQHYELLLMNCLSDTCRQSNLHLPASTWWMFAVDLNTGQLLSHIVMSDVQRCNTYQEEGKSWFQYIHYGAQATLYSNFFFLTVGCIK